jgi:hypothetical protein
MIFLLAVFLLLIIAFINFFPTLAAEMNAGRPISLPFNMSFPVFIILFVLCYFFVSKWTKYSSRKAFQEDKFLQSASQYMLSKDLFIAEGKYGTTRIPWTDLVQWTETPKLFLFYEVKSRAIIFPKRLLQDAEHEQLRDWLSVVKKIK